MCGRLQVGKENLHVAGLVGAGSFTRLQQQKVWLSDHTALKSVRSRYRHASVWYALFGSAEADSLAYFDAHLRFRAFGERRKIWSSKMEALDFDRLRFRWPG